MVHLAHRNHKISIWKWSGLHLKKWQSPKNSKNAIKTEKIKNSKNGLRHKLPTTQTNLHTKFHENRSITLACIAILARTDNGEQTQKVLLLFLTPRGLKRTQKKFQRDRKKKETIDPIAIHVLRDSCPDI